MPGGFRKSACAGPTDVAIAHAGESPHAFFCDLRGRRSASATIGRRIPEKPTRPAPAPASISMSSLVPPFTREMICMSKREKSNKESKKHAVLTPKEKKAVKLAKKHAGDHVPLVVKSN
jgi:hypothetical protein